jgi:hypothetical protein
MWRKKIMENNKFKLVAKDKWKVMDLYRILHALNILYNRLYVFHFYFDENYEIPLSYLLNSLNYIDFGNELIVDRIVMESPAEFNLRGVGEIIQQLRELIKDIMYRNKIEEEILQTELMIQKVNLMKQAGYSEKKIREVIRTFVTPVNRIKKQIDKNDVKLIEHKEGKNLDE